MIPSAIPLLVLALPQNPSTIRVETNRYDLRVEGTPEEAAAYGRILEAAWPTFREFFHAEPPLPPVRRELEVHAVPRMHREGAGTPGLLFAWRDERNYILAKFRPPVLLLEHVVDGSQHGGETLAVPTPGTTHRAKVTADGNRVTLEIDGQACPPIEAPEGRVGLVSIRGASMFRSVICR